MQQPARPLAQRILSHERGSLRNALGIPSAGELCFQVPLTCERAELVEPRRERLDPGLVR